MNKATKYHKKESCNVCRGVNDVEPTATDEYTICEANTVCRDCGHKDFWAYGFFESMQDIECKCETY